MRLRSRGRCRAGLRLRRRRRGSWLRTRCGRGRLGNAWHGGRYGSRCGRLCCRRRCWCRCWRGNGRRRCLCWGGRGGRLRRWCRSLLLHLTTIARIVRFATLGQDLRLLDPLLALDAPRQVQQLVDAHDVGLGPPGHMGEGSDADAVQLLLGRLIDGTDAQEVVAAWARFGGGGRCGLRGCRRRLGRLRGCRCGCRRSRWRWRCGRLSRLGYGRPTRRRCGHGRRLRGRGWLGRRCCWGSLRRR